MFAAHTATAVHACGQNTGRLQDDACQPESGEWQIGGRVSYDSNNNYNSEGKAGLGGLSSVLSVDCLSSVTFHLIKAQPHQAGLV